MKKIYILLVAFVAVGILVFLFIPPKKTEYSEFKIIDYQLEGKTRRLLVADTRDKRERGLMNYRELNGVDGMIFVFPQKETQDFWNEGTYLHLTLYWLDNDRVIGKSDLPSIEKTKEPIIVSSPGRVDKVVEIVTR